MTFCLMVLIRSCSTFSRSRSISSDDRRSSRANFFASSSNRSQSTATLDEVTSFHISSTSALRFRAGTCRGPLALELFEAALVCRGTDVGGGTGSAAGTDSLGLVQLVVVSLWELEADAADDKESELSLSGDVSSPCSSGGVIVVCSVLAVSVEVVPDRLAGRGLVPSFVYNGLIDGRSSMIGCNT